MDLIWFNYSRLFLFTNKTYSQMPFSLDKQLLKQPLLLFFASKTQALLWATINERLSLRPGLVGPTDKCMGKKTPLIAIQNLWRSYFWLDQLSKNIRWQNDVNLLDDLILLSRFFHHSQRHPTLPGLCRVRVNRFCSKRPLWQARRKRDHFSLARLYGGESDMDSLVVSEGCGATKSPQLSFSLQQIWETKTCQDEISILPLNRNLVTKGEKLQTNLF